jgi:hypothetical protein
MKVEAAMTSVPGAVNNSVQSVNCLGEDTKEQLNFDASSIARDSVGVCCVLLLLLLLFAYISEGGVSEREKMSTGIEKCTQSKSILKKLIT